jgi:hypothetical protein
MLAPQHALGHACGAGVVEQVDEFGVDVAVNASIDVGLGQEPVSPHHHGVVGNRGRDGSEDCRQVETGRVCGHVAGAFSSESTVGIAE